MVTKYGMSEKFGMMGLETSRGQYINGGTNKIIAKPLKGNR